MSNESSKLTIEQLDKLVKILGGYNKVIAILEKGKYPPALDENQVKIAAEQQRKSLSFLDEDDDPRANRGSYASWSDAFRHDS